MTKHQAPVGDTSTHSTAAAQRSALRLRRYRRPDASATTQPPPWWARLSPRRHSQPAAVVTASTNPPDRENTDAAGPTSEDESDPAQWPTDATTGCGHHDDDNGDPDDAPPPRRPRGWVRVVSFAVVPAVALAVAVGAAYLKYQEATARQAAQPAVESVQVAKDGTIAMLSYAPDTAEAKLSAAGELLTGTFRDSYTSLAHDVVIPGAREKRISATATVPAAASVSATVNRAVVLVFVNQAIVMGNDAPTSTTSVVEVTLEKVGNRWLISGFDPK